MQTKATIFAVTTTLAFFVTVPAFAAQLPTDDQCHALARARGAGETGGSRNHEKFIRDCVAGRVPTQEVPRVPEAVRDLRAVSSDFCHELAQNRGAGESSGNRNHERFIRSCLAGKVSISETTKFRAATADLRQRSSEECHALAQQRGSGESSGKRNHDRFIRDCVAGKVS